MSDAATNAGSAPINTPSLGDLLVRRGFEAIYQPKRPKTIFPHGQKAKLYDMAAELIGDEAINYVEFGVHEGWSISQIAQRFRNPSAHFYGFDSFEGLPEAFGTFKPGHFSTGGAVPVTHDERITFVKGWFQETLSEFLATRQFPAPVLIHYDADLYSSTLFLMTTLWHHIPDYYFMFDEFVPIEATAMFDFTRAFPVEYEFFASTEWAGRPQQVLGRLRNSSFRPA